MKQALAQLGAAQRAQQRRAPPAARPSARKAPGGVQALDGVGKCGDPLGKPFAIHAMLLDYFCPQQHN